MSTSSTSLLGAVAFASLLALGALGCESRETTTDRAPAGSDVRVRTEGERPDAEAHVDRNGVDANIRLGDDDDDDVDANIRLRDRKDGDVDADAKINVD